MHYIGATILAICVTVVLSAGRRTALVGILFGVLFLPQGQGIEIFGFNLYSVRLLELAGFARVVMRREFCFRHMNGIDRAVLLAYGYATIMFLLRTQFGHGSSEDVTQVSSTAKIGTMIDVLLSYFLFRGLLKNCEDLMWFLQYYVFVLVPYMLIVSFERVTGQNPFALLGGLEAVWIDGDRVRCFGSFLHPSLLGTFAASFAILYMAFVRAGCHIIYGLAGFGSSFALVILARSGGPLSFLAIGFVGFACWPLRAHMVAFRRLILLAIVFVAAVMKSPIWYLPAKVSLLFGGGGWHRSYLMEQAINDFGRWWLAGMPLDLTKDWFPYLVGGAADITNVYLAFGLDGGVLSIFLFIGLLVRAFGKIGCALGVLRRDGNVAIGNELMLWGLGVVLLGHVNNFLAITYFDQTNIIWLMQLAAISSCTENWCKNIESHELEGRNYFSRSERGKRVARGNANR